MNASGDIASASPRPLAGRRAVIVEADAALAAELESLLTGEGVEVLRVNGRQDVGDCLRRFDPQACLIDLDRPDGRAAALAELFGRLFPDAGTIALAADPASAEIEALLQRIGAEPLAKPVRPSALNRAMARSCRDHDEARERQALRQAALQAKQAANALLSVASHELRTPLNAIIGFSELLDQAQPDDIAAVHDYARTIHASGLGLLQVIDDMLSFAALESGQRQASPAPTDANELMDAVLAHAAAHAKAAGVTLTKRIPARLPMLIADAPLVQKALAALLQNAIHYAGKRERRAGLVARLADTGGLLLQVADNGPGIAADRLAQLTEPFAIGEHPYTRIQGGMGLGLALARGVMQQHGGWLELRSRHGVGTVATLVFPEASLARSNGEPA